MGYKEEARLAREKADKAAASVVLPKITEKSKIVETPIKKDVVKQIRGRGKKRIK
jgi:hypothetical protein